MDLGRRSGKTRLGISRASRRALEKQPIGWFSPTYKSLMDSWRELSATLRPVTRAVSAQEHRIELVSGGSITMWSLQDPDAGRGRKYAHVVVDEAAMIPKLQEAWEQSIRPTLTDLRGSADFFSTPKGINYFKQLYDRGLSDDSRWADWHSWKLPTYCNPHIPVDEIEEARATLAEKVFLQEYLAEFLDLDGTVFRRVNERATATWRDEGEPNHEYVFGVDWGKLNDWTVITVLDVGTREVVHIARFNQIDYEIQVGRLLEIVGRFKPQVIKAEANSIGEPLIERLRGLDLPVVAFTTTNATKAVVVDALALAIEQGHIAYPFYEPLINELVAFEATRLPSGALRYAAPEGLHDDTVISLALAWDCVDDVIDYAVAYGITTCRMCAKPYVNYERTKPCPFCGADNSPR